MSKTSPALLAFLITRSALVHDSRGRRVSVRSARAIGTLIQVNKSSNAAFAFSKIIRFLLFGHDVIAKLHISRRVINGTFWVLEP